MQLIYSQGQNKKNSVRVVRSLNPDTVAQELISKIKTASKDITWTQIEDVIHTVAECLEPMLSRVNETGFSMRLFFTLRRELYKVSLRSGEVINLTLITREVYWYVLSLVNKYPSEDLIDLCRDLSYTVDCRS